MDVDGFVYNINYRLLCGQYLPAVLNQIEAIRKANNYQPKYYVVPDGVGTSIEAYESYEYQVDLNPGSILWAFTFANSGGTYAFNIFDPCTGRASSDSILGTGTSPTLWEGLCILPAPYVVPRGGMLNVEISNLSGTASTAASLQLVLICVEPITAVDCARS